MNYKAKAIELLGEKKPNLIIAEGFFKAANQEKFKDTKIQLWIAEGIRRGVEAMHSKAVEVVVGLLKRIAKMEKESNYQIF